MLFWLFVIILVVGIACIILDWWFWENTSYCADLLQFAGWVITITAAIAIFVSGIFIIDSYGNAEANIAANNQIYESLTYQLENNLYDNDNDLGKKELYNEIQEWNKDLAYYQSIQDNFWFGIYYPNVFDQFEFIEY